LDADPNDSYLGRGLYYAATNLGRINCLDASIGVVGAGNSAGQAAVFLSETCKRVYLVVRGDDLRKSMSSYLALRIEHSPKIEVLLNSEVATLEGEPCLEHVGIRDRKSGTHRVEPIRGLFVMIGAAPNTAWLPESVARDEKGFILTGSQLQREGKWKYDRPPFYLETSCAGVFAAGDARAGSVKRVASAVGEGSMAVAFVHQFLAL
jgi:thioredoxin reductase (NADPH)